MYNISRILKQNIFYVALGIGAISLIAMIAVYTLRSGSKGEEGQKVDLNEGIDLANVEQNIKNDTQEAEEVIGKITNDIVDQTTEEVTTEEITTEEITTEEEIKSVMNNNAGVLAFNSENGLGWPLVGNVILPYSMDTTIYFQTLEQYRCNPGMLIQGEVGSPVMASAEGEVISIEQSKEYGNVITVDMGSGYKAVYGQLDNIIIQKGDTVVLGTQLGQVGTPTSYYEKEGSHLYFAITKDGTPINPMTLVSE